MEHCSRYNLSTAELNSQDDKQEHVLVLSLPQDKYDVSLLAKLNLDAEEGLLGLKFFVVKTHRREIFPKMKMEKEYSRRKRSSGFNGDTGREIFEYNCKVSS